MGISITLYSLHIGEFVLNVCCIFQELDIIYKIPHCVPISAHHKWNFDDLLEMMWEYLRLVRL